MKKQKLVQEIVESRKTKLKSPTIISSAKTCPHLWAFNIQGQIFKNLF
jgi:hypothetical protein